MASPIRFFQPGSVYHVYNRGNRKENIFLSARDYNRFLGRLRSYKENFFISVLAYCLMSNHFHLILRQDKEIQITNFMLRLETSYAKYFNIKYELVGSLFQDRFKAKLIETDEYLLHLSRYIHRNPLEIQLPTPGVELRNYRWSSYEDYLKGEKSDLVDPTFVLGYFKKENKSKDYQNFTEYDFKEDDLLEISSLILEKV